MSSPVELLRCQRQKRKAPGGQSLENEDLLNNCLLSQAESTGVGGREWPKASGTRTGEDSPLKVKARRLGGSLSVESSRGPGGAVSAGAAPPACPSRLGLTSPLRRRLPGLAECSPADVQTLKQQRHLLASPLRPHFPLTSQVQQQSRSLPRIPVFPDAASVEPFAGAAWQQTPATATCNPSASAPSSQPAQKPSALCMTALLSTTAAAAAAAARGSEPCSPPRRSCRQAQEPASSDAASPAQFREREASEERARGRGAEEAAVSDLGEDVQSPFSRSRRAAAALCSSGQPRLCRGAGDFSATPSVAEDFKASPASSRRRASPFCASEHRTAAAGAVVGAPPGGEAAAAQEALSPYRLTPPRSKPVLSFDRKRRSLEANALQAASGERGLKTETSAHQGSEVEELRRQFLSLQESSGRFQCSPLDLRAAEAAVDSARGGAFSVKVSRQLERLSRLYGVLRILFDRLYDSGKPLLLFASVWPAYSRVASTVRASLGDEAGAANASASLASSSVYGLSSGALRMREQFAKDVCRLVWLAPELLRLKARRLPSSAAAAAAAASTFGFDAEASPLAGSRQSPLRVQQCKDDVEVIELIGEDLPLRRRAPDSERRCRVLQTKIVAFALQWQNFCLEKRQGHVQKLSDEGSPKATLKESRQLLIARGQWIPDLAELVVCGAPSPPAVASPLREEPESLQQRGSPLRLPQSSAVFRTASPLSEHLVLRGVSPLTRTTTGGGTPTRTSGSETAVAASLSPISERLRRRTEERMAAKSHQQREACRQQEALVQVKRLSDAALVLRCLLDACVYQSRRRRIDSRVLLDLFVSKSRSPLKLPEVEAALSLLEQLVPDSIQFKGSLVSLVGELNPAFVRERVSAKLEEAKAYAASLNAFPS